MTVTLAIGVLGVFNLFARAFIGARLDRLVAGRKVFGGDQLNTPKL